MSSDPKRVIVTQSSCHHCGVDAIEVYHQHFPEMRISGDSDHQAAERLLAHLESELDAVSDPLHRDPVQRAITDVQAFVSKQQAKRSPQTP